jgi:hypothetical protein
VREFDWGTQVAELIFQVFGFFVLVTSLLCLLYEIYFYWQCDWNFDRDNWFSGKMGSADFPSSGRRLTNKERVLTGWVVLVFVGGFFVLAA